MYLCTMNITNDLQLTQNNEMKRLSALHKSAKEITDKMQDLVEKMAKELE